MIVLVAAALVMAMAFLAFVVDLGNARQLRRQAQATADASVLAGAQVLLSNPVSWPNVVATVKAYAFDNLGVTSAKWTGCQDPSHLAYTPDPAGTCISSDSATNPSALAVRVPRVTATSFFGPVLGAAALRISATATATVVRGGDSPVAAAASSCVLCVLSPTASPALEGKGLGTLTVGGGGVLVDSTVTPAASLKGQGSLISSFISGPLGASGFEVRGLGSYFPRPTFAQAVSDPLSGIAGCPAIGTAAPCPTGASRGDVTSGGTLNPGVYGSISLTSGTLTLNPGTYVVTKAVSLTKGVTLHATGVTLYLACTVYPSPCAPGQAGAGLVLSGSGLTLAAPTSGPFNGVAVMSDRNNTAPATLSDLALTGATYLKSARLTFNGTLNATLRGLVVVATIIVDSQADLSVTYAGATSGGTVALSK